MAIHEPYHSERIRAQRGVFTVFPNYLLNARDTHLAKKYGVDCRTMDSQKDVQSCLHKINLVEPHNIARQLVIGGQRDTELYPDIDKYVNLIETSRYYY